LAPIGADETAKARTQNTDQGGNEEMNERLRQWLEARGLDAKATEDEAWAFLDSLGKRVDEGQHDQEGIKMTTKKKISK
jgi:hypothetical protein